MQHNLSENIRKNRKRMQLTQEQLAEAMGVTVGTVSKWENGNCVPDVNLMIELADFFSLSLDTLVGYNLSSKNIDDILDEIFMEYKEHNLEEARKLIEKALVRYPYNIKLLKRAGSIYWMSWHQEGKNPEYKEKARSIFTRMLQLLNDEDGNFIDKIEIRKFLALLEEDDDKKIEIFKQLNVDGIYNDIVAEILWDQGKHDEALNYYDKKLHISMLEVINVALNLINYFFINKKYNELIELFSWVDTTISGMTIEGKSSYLTRSLVLCNTCKAVCYEIMGHHEQMVKDIDELYKQAKAFDANPVYDIYTNVKFVYGPKEDIPVAYDDRKGDTVSEMKKIIAEIYESEELNFTKKELKAIENVLNYLGTLD